MNIEIIILIIIIVIVVNLVCNNNNEQKEHLNEGTFYEVDSNVMNNLNQGLYPHCEKDIRADNVGRTYCNDLPNFKKYAVPLYESLSWIQTRHPSYFYPPYQTNTDEPRYIFSPDWHHSYQ